jgi:signal transduction histidine kinase
MVWRVARAVGQPFGMALFQGDAEPPPSSRRLAFKAPRWAGGIVPLGMFNLIQVLDFVLALILYGTTLSMVAEWNADAARHAGDPSPIWEGFVYLMALAVSLPVALRDRWPLAAWRVAAVLVPVTVWITVTVGPNEPPYVFSAIAMYLLVLYSVAVRCDRRITLAVWIITALAAWIIHPDSMPLVTVVVSVAMLFGYNVRARRSATTRLVAEERRSRLAESAQAVLEERARIARELHDVVAHHMSVIAIQAEAVPLKAAGDPAQLEAGLAEIRSLSLEAITELRQVLGVLRDQEGRTDTAPQPGLDRVDELVDNARAAGLAVLVKRSGPLDTLPPAVGLSAYRIVQESLSNAMRHAPGATVAVDIRLATGPDPGSDPGSDMGPGTQSGTGLDAEPSTGLDAEPSTGLDAEPSTGLDAEPSTGLDAEPSMGLGRGLNARPDVRPDVAPDPGLGVGAGTEMGGGRGRRELRLRVANGPGTAPGATAGAGQGLVGMHERAALLGGTVEAGPQPGGGFEVRATLPLQEAQAAT